MAAVTCEKVNIAGDCVIAIPARAACWMARILLLYLGDRQTRDCLGDLVGDAAGTSTFPCWWRGHCKVDKAVTVRNGAYEGSVTSADWPLTAVTD